MEYRLDAYTIFCHDDIPFELVVSCMEQGIAQGYRIHVLNYNGNSEKNKLPKQTVDNIIWNDASRLDDADINIAMEMLKNEDILFVFGAEKLVPNVGKKPAVEIDFIDKTSRFHFEEEEDWEAFCTKLNLWYERALVKIRGLFIFLEVTEYTEQKIVACLQSSNNMSINTCRYEGESIKIQRKLYETIMSRNYSLQDINRMVENERGILGRSVCRYIKATAYKIAGDLQSAIDILLEEKTENLESKAILLLADCYYLDGRGNEALQLLENLYQENPYTRGLAEALIRASQGTSKEEEWIETLYQKFPNEMGVLEAYATLKSRKRENKIAAQIFRSISEQKSGYYKNYYELVARMNDIIDGRVESDDVVWQYIYAVVVKECSLNNEAVFRSACYFKNVVKDTEAALRILEYADISIDEPRALELIAIKVELLKSVEFMPDVQCNFDLPRKKIQALLEMMSVCCCESLAYSRWREYMDSMSMDEWSEILYSELLCMIPQFAKIDYDAFIQGFTLENLNEVLRLLTENGGYVKDKCLTKEELKETIKGAKIHAEMCSEHWDKPWADYYGSLMLSYKADYQSANNHALTLFQNAETYQDRLLKKLNGYLGLLAWGNNQFKLGRKEEGIACIMAGFLLAGQIQIYTPFLENGVPILMLFIISQLDDSRNKEKEAVDIFVQIFSKYCPLVADWFQEKDDYAVIENELPTLTDKEICPDEKLRSALIITNCISKLQRNNIIKAFEVVCQYGDRILEALEARKDGIEKVYIMFAQVLWAGKKKSDNTEKIYSYINSAICCSEEERKVFHQEERTAVSQNTVMVYQLYLDFLVIQKIHEVELLPDGKNVDDELFFCVQKLLPRTLEEQNIYNNECSVTDEKKEQFEYYIELYRRYQILKRNAKEDDESLQEIERELADLIDKLKENHPYFQPLTEFHIYSRNQVQNKLREGEAVIHYVLKESYLVLIMFSDKEYRSLIIPNKNLENKLRAYAKLWEVGGNQEKCQELSDDITKNYFRSVYDFIKSKQKKRIYIIPDFKLGLYSLAGSRCNNKYLIKLVDSVIHISNYNILWRNAKRQVPKKIYNEIYGDNYDHALQSIDNWLNSICHNYKCISIINHHYDCFLSEEELCAYIVYGHGFHRDGTNSIVKGALGLWDGSRIVSIREVLSNYGNLNFNYFFLMSCSGGIPVGSEPEKNPGSWVQMIERLRGGIISCHWDVKVDAVCYFLTSLLGYLNDNEEMDIIFLKALNMVRQKFNYLEDWAGFEYWEN